MVLNPAKSVIDKVGGYAAAARVTGKDVTRVYRWTYPTSRGGTGGLIPSAEALKLLDYAREHGIALGPADFLQAPSVVENGSSS